MKFFSSSMLSFLEFFSAYRYCEFQLLTFHKHTKNTCFWVYIGHLQPSKKSNILHHFSPTQHHFVVNQYYNIKFGAILFIYIRVVSNFHVTILGPQIFGLYIYGFLEGVWDFILKLKMTFFLKGLIDLLIWENEILKKCFD